MDNAPQSGANSDFGTVHLRRKFGFRNSEFGEIVTSARRQPKRYIREKVTSANAECAFGARSEVGKKVGGRRSEVGEIMRLRRKFGFLISEFGEIVTSARRQPKRYIRHKVTSARAKPMRYIGENVTSANAERERYRA